MGKKLKFHFQECFWGSPVIPLREAFKKQNKKCGFFPQLPDPPPLKCGNTFWGDKKILKFSPKNDLPTHKNSKFWSLVSVRGIPTLEGDI